MSDDANTLTPVAPANPANTAANAAGMSNTVLELTEDEKQALA